MAFPYVVVLAPQLPSEAGKDTHPIDAHRIGIVLKTIKDHWEAKEPAYDKKLTTASENEKF